MEILGHSSSLVCSKLSVKGIFPQGQMFSDLVP